MNNLLVAIIGESGSGKSTVIEEMNRFMNFYKIDSYTTRPRRTPDEAGHRFVNIDNYRFIYKEHNNPDSGIDFIIDTQSRKLVDFIAYTYFDGHHYWSISDQVVEKGCTLYTIDPAGLKSLKKRYGDSLLVFYLKTSLETRKARMLQRGDYLEKVEERLAHDAEAFKLIKCDYVIDTDFYQPDTLAQVIMSLCHKELNKNG